jgi:hypothetical protein
MGIRNASQSICQGKREVAAGSVDIEKNTVSAAWVAVS